VKFYCPYVRPLLARVARLSASLPVYLRVYLSVCRSGCMSLCLAFRPRKRVYLFPVAGYIVASLASTFEEISHTVLPPHHP
jgi:hypothetical protein